MESQLKLIPTNKPNAFNVRLTLPFENRFIGTLDTTGDGTFTTVRKPEHIFRKTNSLGINYSLLTDSTIMFKWIVIDYQGSKLVTSRSYFLHYGKCFKFNSQGFELQCFLPISEFGIQRAREYEFQRVVQPDLFEAVV